MNKCACGTERGSKRARASQELESRSLGRGRSDSACKRARQSENVGCWVGSRWMGACRQHPRITHRHPIQNAMHLLTRHNLAPTQCNQLLQVPSLAGCQTRQCPDVPMQAEAPSLPAICSAHPAQPAAPGSHPHKRQTGTGPHPPGWPLRCRRPAQAQHCSHER